MSATGEDGMMSALEAVGWIAHGAVWFVIGWRWRGYTRWPR